jgi:hypothetical protein
MATRRHSNPNRDWSEGETIIALLTRGIVSPSADEIQTWTQLNPRTGCGA